MRNAGRGFLDPAGRREPLPCARNLLVYGDEADAVAWNGRRGYLQGALSSQQPQLPPARTAGLIRAEWLAAPIAAD
ncbi:hypothetical protein [Burkholderia paludis]|uniref:hypothetical protein n=1 Tax=Burkholderia paludis TaxID=1506587 RepID=UPI000AF5CFC9|nr:hypothetical protein [Burkholderia paludis]